jgi:uncharacterized protein YjbI with pentapeptide repeats
LINKAVQACASADLTTAPGQTPQCPDLTGASLSGARLIRADLTGAEVAGVQWSENTVWPTGAYAAEIRQASAKQPDGSFQVSPRGETSTAFSNRP